MTNESDAATALDLLELPLREVADRARAGPLPGAGSVAAIVATLAAALTGMSARMSRESWAGARGAAAQAEALRARAERLAAGSEAAYAAALAALVSVRVGAESDDDALGAALEQAVRPPLDVAEVAADVALLAKVVADEGNADVRADAAAAAALAAGAARAAAHLVEINLLVTPNDQRALAARALATAAADRAQAALSITD